ncbi:MAG: hypothetical protein EOO73_17160 [Myxococcales bacterium]|nr:MAG: hypothetical protein EOO73_17160 [Myxococcales bacterium]
MKTPKGKRRALTAAIVALLAYPVLGTLALWTGFVEWIAESEDLRLEIDNPSYTIWPGRVHLKRVVIWMNGDTQFVLEGHDLFASISIWDLIHHRIHVKRLATHHVIYRMRVQVKDTQGSEKRLAAYPKLEGLPGTNTVKVETAAKSEEREASWTVQVDGIDISVQELWFFEYRYLGGGRLRGGFTVGPHLMEVRTAVQDLGPGELRFGEKQLIANNLRGQINCEIPAVDPEAHADASFLELVSARLMLRANVATLQHVTAYLPPDMSISKGAGPLAFDLFMEKGFLGKKSHLDFKTEALGIKGNGFGVATDWLLTFDAAAEPGGFPLGKSDFKSTYFSVAKRDRELTIQSHGHHVEAALDTIRLGGATDLKRAALRMPSIVSNDLDDLDVVFSDPSPVSVKGGEAKASLNLDMDENYWAKGPLKAEILRTKAVVAGVTLAGNTWLNAGVRINPKKKVNTLDDMSVRIRNASMNAGDENVDGWWMNVIAKELTYRNTEPPSAEGSVSVRTKNLQPALEALAEKDVISDIVPVLTRLDDFRAKTTFRKVGDNTDMTIESESDIWDVAGRVYTTPKQTFMALVVGGQAVSVGVAELGDGLKIRPLAKTDWLNEQLARFPKPAVRMKEKP